MASCGGLATRLFLADLWVAGTGRPITNRPQDAILPYKKAPLPGVHGTLRDKRFRS